jgi:RNase adaptor protein for sRNA GlmZ degradation
MNQHTNSPLIVEITSFSFKAPLPPHMFSLEGERHGGGFVFDCRSLPNPGREERFKSKTGLDADVCAYLEAAGEISSFRDHTFGLVDAAVRNFLERGFLFMNVSFGCTGGQHRSVFFTEQLAQHLAATQAPRVTPKVIHYNLVQKGFIKG